MVLKYGPPEPGRPPPGLPFQPGEDMIIKYGPPEPRYPGIRPEEPKDEEIRAILKQITACLRKIKKLLEKTEAGTITEELGLCITELSLLYLKLNDLQKSGGVKIKPKR